MPTSAAKHYRNLRVYFHWLTEGEIKEDPMVRVEKPQVAAEAKPFFAVAELVALAKPPEAKTSSPAVITRLSVSSSIRYTDVRPG
jgi:site-specific recombinase XerD